MKRAHATGIAKIFLITKRIIAPATPIAMWRPIAVSPKPMIAGIMREALLMGPMTGGLGPGVMAPGGRNMATISTSTIIRETTITMVGRGIGIVIGRRTAGKRRAMTGIVAGTGDVLAMIGTKAMMANGHRVATGLIVRHGAAIM